MPLAPPNAPAGVVAIAGDASVALSWPASATATNYYVKRSASGGNGYTTVGTNASLTFTNTGLNNGTLYFYVVSAVNGSGEGGNSSEVSARPTSLAPVTVGVSNLAGSIYLSWPADHTGWQLQSQTNNLASGLGTNWVNVSSSTETNQVTVPLNATNAAVFFRLQRP
jgi:cellulose 1,4-beta-cellobiosidase